MTTPLVREVCRDFDIRSSGGAGPDNAPKKSRSATDLTKSDEQVLDTVMLRTLKARDESSVGPVRPGRMGFNKLKKLKETRP